MIICNTPEDCVEPDLNQEPEVWNCWHRWIYKAKVYKFEVIEMRFKIIIYKYFAPSKFVLLAPIAAHFMCIDL
jgi:hypothetical protein